MVTKENAPGAPGIASRWTSSAKSGVGTSLNPLSRVWFTLSHGIFDEIYYPRVDQASVRDMELIVTDGKDFFSEEKRQTEGEVSLLAQYAPIYHLTNRDREKRYRIEKDILSDPARDVVLQRTKFIPLKGDLSDYHLYVLLAPHIGNQGAGNTAWVGSYKGTPMLMAERDGSALALACSAPWLKRSAGFVGVSDGWQDLNRHKQVTWEYSRAENGNVALTGEIDLQASNGEFVLALGFGRNHAEAGMRALASLEEDFKKIQHAYVHEWQTWQKSLLDLHIKGEQTQEKKKSKPQKPDLYHTSAAVLRIHEAKRFPGGLIASLSIPWGFAKGDDDLGGYHLVWPRDLVEMAGGFLAAGAPEEARRVLNYLKVTQEADGHWPQNMWLDGTSYWGGTQMDETAFPILFLDLALREKAIHKKDLLTYWPMVRKAASFLVRNGPVTQQDRWEEDPGYSPFTLAVEIAALLAAADMAETNHEKGVARYLRETADVWNANIERWIYVTGGELAQKLGVDGYYVRLAPPGEADASSPAQGFVPIKNRPPDQTNEPAASIVSPDALALVRFGLRSPKDPRICNTVKAIDELLKVETPYGPAWHRYNDDGYGEHQDGSPFDGTGIGRAWPLLSGERAHYELAAGNTEQAKQLLRTMEAFSNEGSLLPEQIWDAEDIPDKELYCGRPSGSAMPLGWAHAEYIKLRRSLHDGAVFDMPRQTVKRYLEDKIGSDFAIWRFNHKVHSIPAGSRLRIESLAPARVHWSVDGWKTIKDVQAQDTGLGVYTADLPVKDLSAGDQITFTFYWPDVDRWEGQDFVVEVET
ncbi:MAG: glucan 1,4-alpha-glucosidase [Anaerolineales bacterium]|jgi:glucoamylase